jgi:phosphoglycerol transferase
LENNYSNSQIFPDLTPNLDRLAKQATVFSNITQIEDTGYTISGMVASQCGIPLVSPTHGNTLQGMDSFLPGTICLSDILKQAGYHLAYYGGASLKFAGKGIFYETHKYDEVYGKDELTPLVNNSKDTSAWGVNDGALFPIITKAFDNLSASSYPFVLTFLTLETHHPTGVHSSECDQSTQYANGKNNMLNSVHCSDQMIGAFIDHILNSPHASSTIIAIVSDHLGLPNEATELLNNAPRFNRFIIIDPTNINYTENTLPGSTIDVAPTILPFIGFSSDIGFGRNLMNTSTTQAEIYKIKTNIKHWYPQIKSFWQFPTLTQ